MAEWKSTLNLMPEVVLESADQVSKVLKKFRTVLNIILTILETAKMFLIDLGNPLKVILEGIVEFIVGILNDLNQSVGIYILLVGPVIQGQKFLDIKGGIANFNQKFAAALYDSADGNRPQFTDTSEVHSFVIVLDSGNLAGIVEQFVKLIIAIGESITQNLPPPDNVRATPIDKDDGLLVSNLSVMKREAVGVQIDWTLGGAGGTNIADSFVPSKWRIERSKTRAGEPFLIDEEVYNAAGEKTTIKKHVFDTFGRPVYIWEHVEDITASDATFWGGVFAGSYTYKDKTVNPGETWFYRIRSMIGDPPTTVSESDVKDGVLTTKGLLGTPCSPVEVYVPKKADGMGATDDPVAALSDTIYAALILGFHVPYKGTPAFPGHGSLYKSYPWVYQYLSAPVGMYFYELRLLYAIKLADVIAMSITRSKEMFQSFWDTYQDKKGSVKTVLNYQGSTVSHPYLSEASSLDTLQNDVYAIIISFMGALATRGDPPNWIAFRVSNLIPAPVFGVIRKIEAEIRGLLEAYEGIVKDIISFIELLEARIVALNDLIGFVEEIIEVLKNLTFPSASTVLVHGSGLGGMLNEYLAATGGPEPNDDNYTVGAVLLFAIPGLAPLFELLQGGD